MNNNADVIVCGAGAAGLMAAMLLAEGGKKVIVLEAKQRCGGRIHTYTDEHFTQPVELGAEFVHGDLPVTLQLAKEAGLEVLPVKGAYYAHQNNQLKKDDGNGLSMEVETALKDLDNDVPVEEFLNGLGKKIAEEVKNEVRGYVSGYYAAEVAKASTQALKEEWFADKGNDKRIKGGYKQLIDFLAERSKRAGVTILLQHPVTNIDWNGDKVRVNCDNKTFVGTQAVVTVPLGVLQADTILFNPFPHELRNAVSALGFGAVIKFQFQFKEAFWRKAAPDVAMLFSNEVIPTWWTQHPAENNLLTGWLAGDEAKLLVSLNRFELKEKAVQSLSNIFGLSVSHIESNLTAWYINNWYKGPFARGGYSYATVTGEAWKKSNQPYFDNKLFFAGEAWHLGTEVGTVEAALQSGKKAAEVILH